MVISRTGGTSLIADRSSPARLPGIAGVSAQLGMPTLVSLNSGMKRDTGSLSRIFPSSSSVRIATAVTGFDIDASRKMASVVIGFFDSRSMNPRASKCATLPRRATSVTAPEISFASMCRWTISPIRFRRSDERPTSSGLATDTAARGCSGSSPTMPVIRTRNAVSAVMAFMGADCRTRSEGCQRPASEILDIM